MGAFTAPCQPRCLLAADAGVPFLNKTSCRAWQGESGERNCPALASRNTLRYNASARLPLFRSPPASARRKLEKEAGHEEVVPGSAYRFGCGTVDGV